MTLPKPIHTKIEKVIRTFLGMVVLESNSNYPFDESNLYCLDEAGKILWRAEKPEPSTLYSRVKLNDDGTTLSTYSINGHACEIDLRTGKLISQVTMK